ncbi:outer membrane protein assembly factor BamB family protein [Pseudocnuella soli]|uniref:outer membrane protein assembly factor BamB family protein n=1 Tax=Pseudocnuella soli TaxID=2502779 RepID=UPI001045CC03|nr:PQQ-binding-like beta-propeller repeat protein [Pseudocnuella soli]
MLLRLLPFLIFSFVLFSCADAPDESNHSWSVYGGSKEKTQYSSLSQIDTSNAAQLEVAWVYRSGDADTVNGSQIQCNPLVVDGILYGTSPTLRLFALDAATGRELWVFNPFDSLKADRGFFIMNNSRGLAYWTDGKEKRLFYTAGSYLYCIDGATGTPIPSFGTDGKIDLHDGLDRDVTELFVTSTSPGIVYKDLIIMGTRVDEGAAAAPGHIRAFNVRTGKREWIFHTIPQPGQPGYDTWQDTAAYKNIGGANVWSGFSLDEQRGLLFCATGSASFDFYGGKRKGANLYANCVLALDAATGKHVWHFQGVHHDVWDRDFPTPPVLLTLKKGGRTIDAVAQVTKTGFVFVFERETGKPVFPIREMPVPINTTLVGEELSPTQPVPQKPLPFVRQKFTPEELNHLLPPASFEQVKKALASYKSGGLFEPPSEQGTVVLPGFDGGGEWGGPAVDPETGILYVNANEMAWILTMVPLKNDQVRTETKMEAGKRLYQANCMTCHGPERKGSGANPSLINVGQRYNNAQFHQLISSGRRMMPSFNRLHAAEKEAIAAFVLDQNGPGKQQYNGPATNGDAYLKLPYSTTGYNKFLSPEGLNALRPPWGTINAIDLNTGEFVWRDTLGDHPLFKAHGIRTGRENYGGPVVTKGGLLFIGATPDSMFRVFNKTNGRLLWETTLPAPAFATPAVYAANNRQYVVVACGGGKLGTKSGDYYVAFALPQKPEQ